MLIIIFNWIILANKKSLKNFFLNFFSLMNTDSEDDDNNLELINLINECNIKDSQYDTNLNNIMKDNKIELTDSSDSNQSKMTKYDHLKIVK